MQSSSRSRLALLAAASTLVGCVTTSAPDLPRFTEKSSEQGFSAVTQPAAYPAMTAVQRKPAMVKAELWEQLGESERISISEIYDVRVLASDAYGLVIDAQGQDQSSAGTHGGAALGGAVASAAYLDHAFRGGNNYSAGAGLAIGLLGAVIGSTMDRPATAQYQFRYTVQHGDGEIAYFDEVKSSAFRHSVGVCILTPSLTLVSQQICKQTDESLRARYLTKHQQTPLEVTQREESLKPAQPKP